MRELMLAVELRHREDGRSELKVTDRQSGIVLFTADLNPQESKTLIIGGTVNGGRGVYAQVAEAERLSKVGMIRWNASLSLAFSFDRNPIGQMDEADQRLLARIDDNQLLPELEHYAYHRVDRHNFGLTWIVYGYADNAEEAVEQGRRAAAQMEQWAIEGKWMRPGSGEPVQAGDGSYFPKFVEQLADRDW